MLINSIEIVTVIPGNADFVPSENSQRHSLEKEIALALILKTLDLKNVDSYMHCSFIVTPI